MPGCAPLVRSALIVMLVVLSAACSNHTRQDAQEPDTIAPELSLIGPQRLQIAIHDTYTDPGVYAIDARDGDLSDRVQIFGQVNTKRTGTYLLHYQVQDSAGNVSSVLERYIEVLPPSPPAVANTLPAYLSEHPLALDLQLWKGPESLSGSGFRVEGEDFAWRTSGFYTGETGVLVHDNLQPFDENTRTGFIWLKVERESLSIAEQANPDIFYGSSGALDGIGEHLSHARTLIYGDAGADQSEAVLLYKSRHHRFTYVSNAWQLVNEYLAFNSHVAHPQDKIFAEVLLTWQGTQSQLYVDGILIAEQDNDSHVANSWRRIFIGRRPYGDALQGVINRVVAGSGFIHLSGRTSTKSVAVLGDSFAVAGSSRRTITREDNAKITDIDALQTSTQNSAYTRDVLRTSARGASGWIHQLQASVLNYSGHYQPVYNAACSGHGWVNAPDRDAAGEIPDAFIDAAIAQQPELVIVLASVNDLLPHIRVDKADDALRHDLDRLIDRISNLEAVLLIQTFGWYQPDHIGLHEDNDHGQAWLDRYHAYNRALARLDNYRGVVKWVTHDWGAQPPLEYLIGSAPLNTSASQGVDYHPAPAGHVAIAEIVYAALAEWL